MTIPFRGLARPPRAPASRRHGIRNAAACVRCAVTARSIARSPDPFRRGAAWRTTIWLLIGLIALQVVGLGALAVIAPSHTHRTDSAPSLLVLEDFRRGPIKAFGTARHVASALGHVHRFDAPLRHHHAHGDRTVVLDDRDVLQQAAEPGTSPTLMALVGLPAAERRSVVPPSAQARPAEAAHAWRSHDPESAERPPRSA